MKHAGVKICHCHLHRCAALTCFQDVVHAPNRYTCDEDEGGGGAAGVWMVMNGESCVPSHWLKQGLRAGAACSCALHAAGG